MKAWPLRRKLALWSALVTALALIAFGATAAINLKLEKAEARQSGRFGAGESADDSIEELGNAYLFALPVAVIVVGVGSWWLARRALQPVAEITRAAALIDADGLGERLPELATDDEIGRHIRVLNAMFVRLHRSFTQATRFTADASHELRTPLSILRGEIEEELRRGDYTPPQQRFFAGMLDQVAALQQIAANLLLLSRLDADRSLVNSVPLDLSRLVAEAGEDAELLGAGCGLAVRCEIASGLRVNGESSLLKRALLNLIDNAVRYNRVGGSVELRLEADRTDVCLTVLNSGPSIPVQAQADLFKRFSRIEGDRSRQTGGSGLGLSLCREIVRAHGGTVTLARSNESGTEFCLRLPLLTTPLPA
jgi:signal transduction histidine kinase